MKDVHVVECAKCGQPTIFVEKPRSGALCAKCAGQAEVARAQQRSCPVDGTPLEAFTTADVVVDRCPSCGGVWLDAGELSAIMAGVAQAAGEREREVAQLLLNALGEKLPPKG